MTHTLHSEICSDTQIKKFCAYGFLKNFKFFAPYFLIFLMEKDISLLQIGLLISLREVIVNLFEIPSGLIADHIGRKKELILCFCFYIIAYIIFFFTHGFTIAAFGMAFYGLGEAFRSGTHKAMIYTYLDLKGWESEKKFVYGRTRSFSLVGNAVSGLIGIALILIAPSLNYIFLFSIIPFILDTLIVASYPRELDCGDKNAAHSFKDMLIQFGQSIKQSPALKAYLIEDGLFEAAASYIKDLIQPILQLIILGSGITLIASLNQAHFLKIILGLIYTVINLLGALASKNAHILTRNASNANSLLTIHVSFAILLATMSLAINVHWIVYTSFLLIYMLHSMRKPILIDEIDNYINKSNRAAVLSVASQLKSISLMILAPLCGYLADAVNLSAAIAALSSVMILSVLLFTKVRTKSN